MKSSSKIKSLRSEFHHELAKQGVLSLSDVGTASNADGDNQSSIRIARGICERIGLKLPKKKIAGQTAGNRFEKACEAFIQASFNEMHHLRPGSFQVSRMLGTGNAAIWNFEQYEHLAALNHLAKRNPVLSAALGADYIIKPDVFIFREPETDEFLDPNSDLLTCGVSSRTSLRRTNNDAPLLHASISCKWTMRSDRAQNTRSESLNLIRNRKGRLPHIVAITAEPTPSRIASLALGTGDIDCVYHFALDEFLESVVTGESDDSIELANNMVDGKRLRDISDLPFDLVT